MHIKLGAWQQTFLVFTEYKECPKFKDLKGDQKECQKKEYYIKSHGVRCTRWVQFLITRSNICGVIPAMVIRMLWRMCDDNASSFLILKEIMPDDVAVP